MNGGEEEEEKKENLDPPTPSPHTLQDYLKLLLIILLTILIGVLTINQAFEWKYKAEFLQAPCQLCEELNPHLSVCFEETSVYYTDLEGNLIENLTEYERAYWNLTFPTSSSP